MTSDEDFLGPSRAATRAISAISENTSDIYP